MHTPHADAVTAEAPLRQPHPIWRTAGLAALAVAVLGLIGRMLSYPLNRDENMFVSVAQGLTNGDLYRDLGYNHLPNLAYLYSGIFEISGSQSYLLVARLVVAAFWLLALFFLWRLARHEGSGFPAFLVAASTLVCSTLLLGAPGMLATNNFIPVALVFPATLLLFKGIDGEEHSPMALFGAGAVASLAIGFKANYIFLAPFFALAVLIAPKGSTLGQKITYGLLPLGLGGIAGGLPALMHLLADPDAFFAHTLRYFTELQVAYWDQSDAPKTVSLKDKILLAQSIWFANTSLLALVLIGTQMAVLATLGGLRSLIDWKVLLLSAMALCGYIVAFIPSPSFVQYFVPPLPFLVLLILVLAGKLPANASRTIGLLCAVATALALVNATPRLGPGLASLLKPSSWSTTGLGTAVRKAGQDAGLEPGDRVATLSPILALEGGYSIYPEFAAGQFVYRTAPFMTADDRTLYRTTSPAELDSFLDADPPAAILIHLGEPMEADFARYAGARNYRLATGSDTNGAFELYVAPQ